MTPIRRALDSLLMFLAARFVEYVVEGRVGEQDVSFARKNAVQEVYAIPGTIIAALEYHHGEVDILSDRLTRRYDVAAAMTESHNRAVVAKAKAMSEASGNGLTAKQKLALRFQEQDLQRRLRGTH